MSPRRCIISLATDHKRYAAGLTRLAESAARSGFTGEFIGWPPGSFPDGCPAQLEAPFAFKPYCFREAQSRGMDLVLWLDAACVVIRPLAPLFRQIQERGYVLFSNGLNKVGEWASDAALERLGLSREQAMSLPEVSAAAVGLNLGGGIAADFLERWYAEARDGVSFRGVEAIPGTVDDYQNIKWNRSASASADPRVRGHRHDQTVAGILAHQLGMELTAEGIQRYSHERRRIDRRTVIVIDRDLGNRRAEFAGATRIRRDKYWGRWADVLRSLRLSFR